MKENASAIIVGSKGRSQAAALLIGSVAERLLKLNSHLPQYVIKEQRKNMDLMDALSEI
jgi:nucleotide-binding universal stress UspA family protein